MILIRQIANHHLYLLYHIVKGAAMEVQKQYIRVWAEFSPEGKILPFRLEWKDGRRFEIDRVLSYKRRASAAGGPVTTRYEVWILGQKKYLFLEEQENRWFVEIPVVPF